VRGPPSLAAAATEGCHPEEAASRPSDDGSPLFPDSLRLDTVRFAVADALRSALKGMAGRPAWRAEGVPLKARREVVTAWQGARHGKGQTAHRYLCSLPIGSQNRTSENT